MGSVEDSVAAWRCSAQLRSSYNARLYNDERSTKVAVATLIVTACCIDVSSMFTSSAQDVINEVEPCRVELVKRSTIVCSLFDWIV